MQTPFMCICIARKSKANKANHTEKEDAPKIWRGRSPESDAGAGRRWLCINANVDSVEHAFVFDLKCMGSAIVPSSSRVCTFAGMRW